MRFSGNHFSSIRDSRAEPFDRARAFFCNVAFLLATLERKMSIPDDMLHFAARVMPPCRSPGGDVMAEGSRP